MSEQVENANDANQEEYESLNGTQKSAILMMLLGEDEGFGNPEKSVTKGSAAFGRGHVFGAGSRPGNGQSGIG